MGTDLSINFLIVPCSHTCIYLACKVEEFNVSIQQFVANLKSAEREEAADAILSQELLLMQLLHYHLVVHNPFRPLEGLLIDVKVGQILNAIHICC